MEVGLDDVESTGVLRLSIDLLPLVAYYETTRQSFASVVVFQAKDLQNDERLPFAHLRLITN